MRLVFCVVAVCVALSAPASGGDKGRTNGSVNGHADVLAVSMAPALLKAKTQIGILRHDDTVAASCYDKRFSAAQIVTRPRVTDHGARKWQEQWELDRCGTSVGYRVFFTDVGDGGAYFAFQPTD